MRLSKTRFQSRWSSFLWFRDSPSLWVFSTPAARPGIPEWQMQELREALKPWPSLRRTLCGASDVTTRKGVFDVFANSESHSAPPKGEVIKQMEQNLLKHGDRLDWDPERDLVASRDDVSLLDLLHDCSAFDLSVFFFSPLSSRSRPSLVLGLPRLQSNET